MADNKRRYRGKAEHPLAKLKARADVTVKELLAQISIVEAQITKAIIRCKNPAYAKEQVKLFKAIHATYEALSKKIDEALKADVESAAIDAYHRLEDELGDEGLVRWNEERAKRYWQYVAPETSQSLAAVYTNNMSDGAIANLRQALIETERMAALEGWSMNEKQKAVQERWASLCSKPSEFFFVDKGGNAWEHARYLQMLTRTTAQRVYNDSYLDRVAENGINLVRIDSLGAPECDICRAWQGVICSIDGKARGLPSVDDAREAGVFHPNCVCTQMAVIDEEDKAEVALQKSYPYSRKVGDLDAWQARKFSIDRERYERKGMTAQEARTEANRDNLEASILTGLLRSDARRLVESLTSEQVAKLCPDNRCPRFEPLKKGDEPAINRGSRGGIVHIAKNCSPEELQSLLEE